MKLIMMPEFCGPLEYVLVLMIYRAARAALVRLINSYCCLASGGLLLVFPGCFAACYAFGYRKALRTKYNLQEAPCGDFITHLCCHLCALCQEYREIRERSVDVRPDAKMVEITAPEVQTMDLGVRN
ncbi:hypothetical protein L1987_51103 [Smallanthus sonchifolius]|uniref:Uncharacterized protein n=1 Tax=Smallanthus sonchifolius TaxID=185202 RepID=A0ACB9ENV3_9ASTR|nr:hypothetical protein L1987_51103 [Smallanthus sonchifolius]